MNFDLADVLVEVMEMGASDLHLTPAHRPWPAVAASFRRSTTPSSLPR